MSAERIRVRPDKLREVRPRELLVRFAFGCGVSLLAGVAGKVVGAAFGGLFLAFPAILPAALTLIEQKESTKAADDDDNGAVAGAPGLAAFAATVWLLAERPALALAAGLLAWALTGLACYASWSWLRARRRSRSATPVRGRTSDRSGPRLGTT